MLVMQKLKIKADSAETDFDLVFGIYGRMLRRLNWKERLDNLPSDSLVHLAQIVGYESLSHKQLAYIASRFSADVCIGQNRRKRLRMGIKHAFVIYWIVTQEAPDVPLYVGQTQNIGQRWIKHRVGAEQTSESSNLDSLRIIVVETVCGSLCDALKAETKHISAAMTLNPNLFNKRIK